MIIVSEDDKMILNRYIKNIDELINTNTYEELDVFLETIDDIIIANILSNKDKIDEPDAEGIKVQQIYDRIARENDYT